MKKYKVTISACIPAPYQVEFFDAIAAHPQIELRVIYSSWGSRNRQWQSASLAHESLALTDGHVSVNAAEQWVDEADYFVCGWYTDPDSRSLLYRRLAAKRPVALWGERPRARFPIASRLRRRILLHKMLNSSNSIWGIGKWAIDQWKSEFGTSRQYFNIPYFSNLNRFLSIAKREADSAQPRRFLFCGSLIKRKGVDLLAEAFMRLAKQVNDATLTFVGTGKLESSLKLRLKLLGERVSFVGFRQWDELPKTYTEHDVLIAPSRYDGWGMIVPEGLAAGLPVISTTRTGAALDLVTKQNGDLVKANSGESLYHSMARLANLPAADFWTMSQNARSTAASHSLSNGVQRFLRAVAAAEIA